MNKLTCLVFVAMMAVVSCQYGGYSGGSSLGGYGGGYGGGYKEEHVVDYYAEPKYKYEYKVEDPHTGDIKSQSETRDGDVVKGYYALKEADGTIREVHYTSDKKNGFNAEVIRKGQAYHPQQEKKYYH